MNKSRLTLAQTKDLGLKTNVKDVRKCKKNYLTLGFFQDIKDAIDKVICAQRELAISYTKKQNKIKSIVLMRTQGI